VSETRTKIAAGATLLALGGLAGVALSAESSPATGAAAKTAAAPVEVRTQVIRRTVHVIRREKPKRAKHAIRPTSSAAPIPAAAPASVPRVVALPAQPQQRPAPVRTRTSGASGSGSGEHEQGDDHGDGGEGRDD
jgi:hypothetical protein